MSVVHPAVIGLPVCVHMNLHAESADTVRALATKRRKDAANGERQRDPHGPLTELPTRRGDDYERLRRVPSNSHRTPALKTAERDAGTGGHAASVRGSMWTW